MQKVGVEAVVEGLSGFLGDMKKMDSAISGLVPGTKLLEGVFGSLGNTIDGFVNFTLNALAHALGELIADAVEFVIQKLGELVKATIEAGGEFQTLELRLQTLNFNSLTESGMEYNQATTESIRLTKEQLEWLQKLAVTTPYDAQDIANTFTLARSYGFVDDEARALTESITNFASGMGLGNTEIQRIIINFGQMVQQGKVTQREMNDLARGSFVPVNDVLKLMAENLGMSTDELTSFRQTAESVPEFMKAFQQLVGERFTGSAEKMARTFQGASANLKDLVKSLGGLNIVKPILDVIGGRIADFISKLTEGKQWDKLVSAATDVGNSISSIVSSLISFLPDAKSVSDGVVNALEGIANWFKKHRSDITDWTILASRWINNVLIPDIKKVVAWLFGSENEKGGIQKFAEWIQEQFIPAIAKAADWVKNVLVPFLKDDLTPVFLALLPLAAALGDVLITAFGGEPNQSFTDWIHNSLIPGIQTFTDWVTTNKDTIAFWVNQLVIATVELAIFVGAIGFAITAVVNIAAAFLNWVVVFTPLLDVLKVLGVILLVVIGVALAVVAALLASLIVTISLIVFGFRDLVGAIQIFIDFAKRAFEEWKEIVAQTIIDIIAALESGDFVGVGRAWANGIFRGLQSSWDLIIDLVKALAQNAVDAFMETFSFVFDFKNSFGGEQGPTQTPANSPVSPSVNSSVTNTNHYNLAINSNAPREPIIQDYSMLQAFHGQ